MRWTRSCHSFRYETDGAVIKPQFICATREGWFYIEGAALGHRLQVCAGTGGDKAQGHHHSGVAERAFPDAGGGA